MKKTCFALGVLSAISGAAHAQSHVTLYGIVDAGLTYVSNEYDDGQRGRAVKLSDSNMQGSRWGIAGAEDLGGGLRAVFALEGGFSLADGAHGQGDRLFGRQAYVGLSSATAGTLTLGRQYDSVVDYVGPLASGSQWATVSGAHIYDNDNLHNTFRINNAIRYATVNYAGFSASALYGFSNQANTGGGTGFGNNRAWSVGMGYANGPLTLGVGYLVLSRPDASTNDAESGGGGAVSGDFNLVGWTSSTAKARIFAIGGAYALGPATLGLVYSHSYYDMTAGGFELQQKTGFDNLEVNAKYMLTPALQVGAAYTYTWARQTLRFADLPGMDFRNRPKWHQVALGADYWLTKRTDLYLAGVWQHSVDQTAFLNGQAPAGTENQVAVTAGIRHKF